MSLQNAGWCFPRSLTPKIRDDVVALRWKMAQIGRTLSVSVLFILGLLASSSEPKPPSDHAAAALRGVPFKNGTFSHQAGADNCFFEEEKSPTVSFGESNSWSVGRGLSSPRELSNCLSCFLHEPAQLPRCAAANGRCKSLDFSPSPDTCPSL